MTLLQKRTCLCQETGRVSRLTRGRGGDEAGFLGRKDAPLAGWKIAEEVAADTNAEEAEGGEADGGSHPAHLAVFAFDQFEGNPAVGDAFALADGWNSRWNGRLRFKQPGAAGKGFAALNENSASELRKGLRGGEVFDLGPVFPFVGVARLEETGVPVGFIAQEQETFRVGVETANGVNPGGKVKFRERAVRRTVRGELGEDTVGFMEGDEHRRRQFAGRAGRSQVTNGLGWRRAEVRL